MQAQCWVTFYTGVINKDVAALAKATSARNLEELICDPIDLVDRVSMGHCWLSGHYTDGIRSSETLKLWNLVVLDIDGDMPLEEFHRLPFVARHCLFTYTSCSHQKVTEKNPQGLDRYRAVFTIGAQPRPTDVPLIQQLHIEIAAACGLRMADTSGEKGVQPWFGNDTAEVRFAEGEPLEWDFIEAAEEAAANRLRAEADWAASTPDIEITDGVIRLLDFALRHLLPPSGQHGELARTDMADGYEAYWVKVFNAAASDDRLYSAFLEWHSQCGPGHRKEKISKRRWARAGRKSDPSHLFAHLNKRASDWRSKVPDELKQFLPPAPGAPVVLICDPVPVNSQPKRVDLIPQDVAALNHRIESIKASEQVAAIVAEAIPETTERAEPEVLNDLFNLRCYGSVSQGGVERKLPLAERQSLERNLIGQLLENRVYMGQPLEVERALLKVFRGTHNLERDEQKIAPFVRLDFSERQPELKWLIPDYILAGHEHLIYSKPGVGKTYLSLHLTRALSGDPSVNAFLDSPPLESGRGGMVLFIQSDMKAVGKETTLAYLQSLGIAGGSWLERVIWGFEDRERGENRWTLSLASLTQLAITLEGQLAAGDPITAVVIDSMKGICEGGLKVGDQAFVDYMSLVSDIVQKYGASLIWIHHSSKDGGGAQGIARITEEPSVVLKLDKTEKGCVMLNFEKVRGTTRNREPLPIDPFSQLMAAVLDPIEEEEEFDGREESEMSLRQSALFNLLRTPAASNGMGAGTIQQELELSRKQFRNLIGPLLESGAVHASGSTRNRLYSLDTNF